MADKNITIRQQDLDELLRMRRKLDTVRGHGVSTRPDSIVVDKRHQPESAAPEIVAERWLRVTTAVDSGGGVYKHAWVEVIASGSDWATKTGGLTGTDSDRPLIASNGVKIGIGTVVRAWLTVEMVSGTATPTYRTEAAFPVGMYPGMVCQVVSANTIGFDWEHAHSLLT